ncbi:MAG TPA: hypothetical protein VHV51_17290 [Polyangiaceae bacterium]|jgi:hypothetical protein|nr:hypothetical protein [Polyangiaceae bacterium]
MTTRIGVGGPAPNVLALTTAARVTPAPARPFQQVMNASSIAIANGAEAAMNHLPGGSILAAAMRPGAGVGGVATAPAVSATGPTGTAAPSLGLGTSGISGTSTSSGADPTMEQMMSQDADQNMYYLQLQEQMSQESRSYSAVSNVLKARHDTMKNAIGNIR